MATTVEISVTPEALAEAQAMATKFGITTARALSALAHLGTERQLEIGREYDSAIRARHAAEVAEA